MFSKSITDGSRSITDDSRSITDDSRSITDYSRSMTDDSRSINDTSRAVRMTIINDAKIWSFTNNCHSDDSTEAVFLVMCNSSLNEL